MPETKVIVPPTGDDTRSERDILKSIEHNVAYFVTLFEQMIDSMSNLPLPGANRLKRQ